MYSTLRHLYRRTPYMLTVLTALAILWLTLSPNPIGDVHISLFKNMDKVVHAVMFGGLCAVYYFDRWLLRRPLGMAQSWRWCLLFILTGGIIEILQKHLIGIRSAEWADWAADSAGCLCVWIAYCMLIHRRNSDS